MDADARAYRYAATGRAMTPRQARRGRQKARRALDWQGQLLFTLRLVESPPELVPRGR